MCTCKSPPAVATNVLFESKPAEMPFAIIFQVVLFPQGKLRDPATCMYVETGRELRAAEGMWHKVASFQAPRMPPQSRQNPVLEDPPRSNPVPSKNK